MESEAYRLGYTAGYEGKPLPSEYASGGKDYHHGIGIDFRRGYDKGCSLKAAELRRNKLPESARERCLLCKFFAPMPSEDWKPTYKGEEYDRWDVQARVKKRKLHDVGKCTFYPTHADVLTCHGCGQFQDAGYSPGKTLNEFIWGTSDGMAAYEQITKLKAQLKAAKALAKKRRETISKMKANGQAR